MEIGRDARAIFKSLKSNWDTDGLKTLLEDSNLGYEGVVKIMDDLAETGDSRTKLKLIQLILEIGGALQKAEKGNTTNNVNNIFMNATPAELQAYLDAPLKSIEHKDITPDE